MQKDRTISRAQGCLLGQLAGDSLGSLVEFRSPEDIQSKYPAGAVISRTAGSGTRLPGSRRTIPKWHSP